MEKEMATHSRTLAWRIPMDGRAWRATVHGVMKRHDWVASHLRFSIFFQFRWKVENAGDPGSIPGLGRYGERNGNTFQYSCLENPMDQGAWCAAISGVAKSWTRLSDFTFFHFQLFSSESEIILPSEPPWKPQIAKGYYD